MKLRKTFRSNHGNDSEVAVHDVLNINEGDIIVLDNIAQQDICRVQLTVGIKTTHHFSGNQFVSHELLNPNGKKICSIIVATKQGGEPYLALSRPIPEQHKSYLCEAEDFDLLCAGHMPNQLYVRENSVGMPDWLNMRYDLQIDNVRGTSVSILHEVRNFNYSLYAASNCARALEIERYPLGDCVIYATIFVPVSKIVRIIPNGRTKIRTSSYANESHEIITNKPANDSVAPIVKPQKPRNIVADVNNVKEKTKVPAKNEDKISVIAQTEGEFGTLRCNLRMAGKLIDEAMRSDMRVVDVMRRALGLSVSGADTINFNLNLSAADYKILADRFELSISDKAAINSLIMEELSHFTGVADDDLP